ncbi:MAG: hypothetical protein ACI4KR_10385 [Ruminiclostridium sp.]
MNYKKLFKTSFSQIIPPTDIDGFERSVLERTEKMENRRINRFKKPLVAAAVAAAALGVTGAAAAGLIDFGEIFGGHLKTAEGYDANELLTCGQDISWTVSDEDYAIEVKGIAGSERDVLVSFEIVRKDGKPVSDFMQKLPEDGLLESMDAGGALYKNCENQTYSLKGSPSYTWDFEISLTDEGNISVYDRITAEEPINGMLVKHSGTDFYPKKDIDEFRIKQYETEMALYEEREANNGIFLNVEDACPDNYISLEEADILSLKLDWDIEFVYNPSEASLVSKSISDDVETVSARLVRMNIADSSKDKEYFTQDCAVIESNFNNIGGTVTFGLDCPDCTEEEKVFIDFNDRANTVALITSDGREIPAYIHPLSGEYDGTTYQMMTFIRYSESRAGEMTVVDIREVTGIKINGAVYPLE